MLPAITKIHYLCCHDLWHCATQAEIPCLSLIELGSCRINPSRLRHQSLNLQKLSQDM
ncbi:hypothetical protein D3C74_488100 [compost metagenome]